MPSQDMPKLYNKYSPFVFLKKLEKGNITGEYFVNLKIIEEAFALANMTFFCLLNNHLWCSLFENEGKWPKTTARDIDKKITNQNPSMELYG